MHISTDIAKRFLLGKKSTNAINWITWVVIIGMAIGTASMIVSMSVFNGFEGLLSSLFNAYNPDYKIYPSEGLYLDLDERTISELNKIEGIESIARSIQEVALFEYDGSQEAGYIKGVDTAYQKVTDIDSTIIRGEFVLEDELTNYAVLGIGIFNKLSVNPSDKLTPISIYMPKRKKRGPLDKDFKTLSVYPSGVFTVGNEDDSQVIIASFDFVNKLLETQNAVSYLEIKAPDVDEDDFREAVQRQFSQEVNIKNRYQQDEAYLKIMNIEKWVVFCLVAMIILILSFNLIGSIWMIILDKRKDIALLKALGMTGNEISALFLKLGTLIGILGLGIGVTLSLIIYFLQKQFGLISVPPGFMIDSYPIALKWTDFILASLVVLTISFIASILPALKARKMEATLKHD